MLCEEWVIGSASLMPELTRDSVTRHHFPVSLHFPLPSFLRSIQAETFPAHAGTSLLSVCAAIREFASSLSIDFMCNRTVSEIHFAFRSLRLLCLHVFCK